MIIDIHVHPFLPIKQILAEMENAGVNYSVLLAIDTDPMDIEKPEIKKKYRRRYLQSGSSFIFPILGRFSQIEDRIKSFFQEILAFYPDLKSSNAEIAELVRKHPDRFIGFGSVNPNKDEEYVEKKLREISELDLKGIKMLPTLQFFNPMENENFERICEYCKKNNLIILYHTGCDPGPWEVLELSEDANPKYLKPILETYKPLIILAHTGSYSAWKPGLWLNEALELGEEFENVYFDSSAASHIVYTDKVIKRIRENIGIERLLYGSDYPVVRGSDMRYEVDLIKNCRHLTDEEKDKILGLNAAKLLGFGNDITKK